MSDTSILYQTCIGQYQACIGKPICVRYGSDMKFEVSLLHRAHGVVKEKRCSAFTLQTKHFRYFVLLRT